jgi:uncharacterized membrane protein YcaP (DUF421 family)
VGDAVPREPGIRRGLASRLGFQCSSPRELHVQDGNPIEQNMKSERLNLDDVMEEARAQQIEQLNEIKWAVLEPSGTITFIKQG